MMIRHKAVFEAGRGEIVEKKSRFIAHVQAVDSVEEAQEFIEAVKKKYWDARHNCSAFSVGEMNPLTRCSDDGEPGGTAGKPILEVIQGSGIRNIVIVVTRYFGGTLLGTGGLVRAYTEAAKAGIENAVIIEKIPATRMKLFTEYTDLGKIQYILAQNQVTVENTEYTDKVEIRALFPEKEKKALCRALTESTGGRVHIEDGEDVYYGTAEGEVIIF
ncbi:MAG TPA: YigZ family protein [Candidatus Anaerobutyricum stercoris]|uniref:YigZ family protein n=1 Tax=Candidatus Anaerobutyricum stercoris TaxID=2838457 RepID=A0A9D2J6Q1_9FIRM|nr:YigZ family protein [Candidatus Anaerobutyricum stercoris]